MVLGTGPAVWGAFVHPLPTQRTCSASTCSRALHLTHTLPLAPGQFLVDMFSAFFFCKKCRPQIAVGYPPTAALMAKSFPVAMMNCVLAHVAALSGGHVFHEHLGRAGGGGRGGGTGKTWNGHSI